MADEGALSGLIKKREVPVDSETPTRDKLNLLISENTPFSYEQVGNFMGGKNQGFYDMGYSDITMFPTFLDAYDAQKRLAQSEMTDNFTDVEEAQVKSIPFGLKVLSLLTGEGYKALGIDSPILPFDSPINKVTDYYDGKKTDTAYIYGAPLGALGLKAGAVKFLQNFKQFKGLMNK